MLLISVLLCYFFCSHVHAQGHVKIETCKNNPLKDTPFCDETIGVPDRIEYLLQKHLTVSEKISLLIRYNPYIERLNISYFNWRFHGLAHSTCQYGDYYVTNYPQACNLAKTFDMENIQKMTGRIGNSARALYNVGQFEGVSFFSPNINIFRDPRWGRGQETPGEDPYLSSEYAVAFIRGLQFGDDEKYLKAIGGAKHYSAYDLENWHGIDRHHFDAKVTLQDLEETFNQPFKNAIMRGEIGSIMCSYNSVNGVPACCNSLLLQSLARDNYKFKGHFLSDLGAIVDIYQTHKFAKSKEEACALALKAGCDLNDNDVYLKYLPIAMSKGLVVEEDLNVGLRRILFNRFRLGEFDDWSKQEYTKIKEDVIDCKENRDLSYLLAKESMVLLKNQNDVLPLSTDKYKNIALIGPNANATTTLLGNYVGPVKEIFSILKGLEDVYQTVKYSKGCDINSQDKSHFDEAKNLAKEADVTVLVMGIDGHIESEGKDRNDLKWPGVQMDLIKEIGPVSKGPVILVIVHGGVLDIRWSKDNLDAILDAGYPSMYGGKAVADVLSGKYSPSGRQTITWYPNEYIDEVNMTDMRIHSSKDFPGRTYKYYTVPPKNFFSENLRETPFTNLDLVYHILSLIIKLSYFLLKYQWTDSNEIFLSKTNFVEQHFSVVVTNIGEVESDDIVLAFITNENIEDAPIKELFGFQRIHLKPKESKTVFFGLKEKNFEYVNKLGEREVVLGKYSIAVEGLRKTIILF